jgi:hypothetical protein
MKIYKVTILFEEFDFPISIELSAENRKDIMDTLSLKYEDKIKEILAIEELNFI